ncbi:ROK family protein [Nocardioides sp. YIM 152315]|uniref:ROK family protein n=1 Tax=Nocardioides sp. YIM 152315 TaxID=3031760 RepID=UPI0023DBC727|nr:ROK family protein [Nocardioides sp. YIM 152315]MDF1602613.1 ROK family protein [Nocardioides sp. YIM 152315]
MTPGLVLAIDVGGTTLKGELVDVAGRVLAARAAPTPRGGDVRDAIAELGRALLSEAGGRPVDGAGVVVPGVVDPAAGIARYSANVGWRDLEIVEALGDAWSLPVSIGNDVAAGGVAELRTGAGRDVADLVFVPIGTGIAGALLSGGRLVPAGGGVCVEIGHVAVRPGMPCGCGGDGCLEAWASAGAIARRYADLAGVPVAGADEVAARVGRDAVADRVWADAVDALADGLTTVALLLAPELVVIGGGLGQAGDLLLHPLGEALEARARVVPAPELTTAVHGLRAGVVGAGMLARDAWSAER